MSGYRTTRCQRKVVDISPEMLHCFLYGKVKRNEKGDGMESLQHQELTHKGEQLYCLYVYCLSEPLTPV